MRPGKAGLMEKEKRCLLEIQLVVQRVRNPLSQSTAQQADSEPCAGRNNRAGDA